MLFTTTLISIASLCLAKEVTKNRNTEPDAIIDQFPWYSFSDETGFDPLKYLKAPAEDVLETLACTTARTLLNLSQIMFSSANKEQKPGPDRVACPAAIAEWFDLVDEQRQINIPGGQCRSVTEGTCRTVACAPRGDVSVALEEVTGYMWKPVSSRCVFGGTGGIWQNNGSTLVIEMGHAKKD
ncbi:unnamed protein product [Fusarium graminearum]|uniref:Chromosome 3, complete genome n=2 Tax=Gibberella zeae TaxID=5518 RepID=I1RPG7_GIBZE|nr:hypothetical protein FGSG_05936 [Fusarium graminearum PH-1]EYB32979.1 hypothetical protein FG05_05936 [Fusarium graminearum]ESU11970.1 hypothetical protein FGSG_05936 [Fusarium graminearum PH-1]CAF3488414.1 unnamed protein product [Fusarium graminearum]CAF3584968.1 unnamed protein product [Fusarium graminearum]CAG1965724.1 unnamed protein product [Fusarium graminearum]|eukprot:XP_011324546.1 hypothetical protein FGSG_05936 [Fusarium graminearum PH-1]